jgi:hypothetical protein
LVPRSRVRRGRVQPCPVQYSWRSAICRKSPAPAVKPWRNAAVPELDRMHVGVICGDRGFLRLELLLTNLSEGSGIVRYLLQVMEPSQRRPMAGARRGVRGADVLGCEGPADFHIRLPALDWVDD